MQTDQSVMLPSQSVSGTVWKDQQVNKANESTDLENLSTDSNKKVLQKPEVPDFHGNDETRFSTASTLGSPDRRLHAGANGRSVEVGSEDLSRSRKERKNRAANRKRDKQVESTDRNEHKVDKRTEEVLETYAIPKRPPMVRTWSSFANPTKTSRVWQTEKAQGSPSSNPPWIPAVSASTPGLGSSHQSIGFVSLSRANSQTSQSSRQSESHPSPRHEPRGDSSLGFGHGMQQDKTNFKTDAHELHRLTAADSIMSEIGQPLELTDDTIEFPAARTDALGPTGESVAKEHVDLSNATLRLQNELRRADEERYRYSGELTELRGDVNQLCNAWIVACTAAAVKSEAVAHFHFLVTDSDVDRDSRAAVRRELVANELSRRISDLQDTIETLGSDSDHKDKVIAMYQVESASVRGIPMDGSQHDTTEWRSLYERERIRLHSLKEQHKRLRFEAERMYRPDLERDYEKCRADLIKARDKNSILAEELRKTKEECLIWQSEAKQHKEELACRSAHFVAQVQILNEEMLSAVEEYRSKVDDSEHWDKDGLIMRNEEMKQEQAILNGELEHVKRNNASKDDQIETLVKRHQQDQQAIEEFRKIQFTSNLFALQKGKSKLSRENIDKLREKQTRQRDEEDAEEALKEKVRLLRVEALVLPARSRIRDPNGLSWWQRWRGNDCSDFLTMEEEMLSKRLRAVKMFETSLQI